MYIYVVPPSCIVKAAVDANMPIAHRSAFSNDRR